MLELNEGLKKGMPMALVQQSLPLYVLSPSMLTLAAAHSLVIMRSIRPPLVTSERGGLATRITSSTRRWSRTSVPPPEWWMPNPGIPATTVTMARIRVPGIRRSLLLYGLV
ncbi:hypothetical protein M9H77_30500 [Catharanthus roseus]|uniref:Uncharacterized protein n=1 Tax=Catharanthus roseus TaxID=4058 RepID=A0ACB9ZZP4_CATRO|nr:hypothetical protein M9H77_30500 [Catharanthus roseus]